MLSTIQFHSKEKEPVVPSFLTPCKYFNWGGMVQSQSCNKDSSQILAEGP